MNKVHLVCSLLMAFCVSMFGLGCDSPKPAPKMTGEAPKTDGATAPKATAKKAKGSGAGSTTGGGVEVPPSGGAVEKTPEATPETKPEEKTEEKTEEKKAE